jgi:hypothetical protein
MAKVKKLSISEGAKVKIDNFPNFHKSGSVLGMKRKYYGKDALLVRCGNYVYNVSSNPEIYNQAQ